MLKVRRRQSAGLLAISLGIVETPGGHSQAKGKAGAVPRMDQTCPFWGARGRKLVARAGGGSFGAAEGWGVDCGCKSALRGKIDGICLERRDDFARLRAGTDGQLSLANRHSSP